MSAAGCRLDIAVAEQLADHRKTLSEGQSPRGKAVAQVMDSHVVEVCAGADAAPGVLEIGQMTGALDAANPLLGKPSVAASLTYSVRRGKASSPCGCKSRPASVAPAGSNRSG